MIADEYDRNVGFGSEIGGEVVGVVGRVTDADARAHGVPNAFERRHAVGKHAGVPVHQNVVAVGADDGDRVQFALVQGKEGRAVIQRSVLQ